jgi:DNA-binding transcriptional ArsR family regulator
MDALARTFAAAAHPVRLQLLRFLLDDEHCVTQCMEHTGAAQSLVSKHLGTLLDAGLVERHRSGRRNYHRVVDPPGVEALLDTASRLNSR